MPLTAPPSSPGVPADAISSPPVRVGLIAGNGALPLIFARSLRERAEVAGVVAVAHRGETDPALAGLVERMAWVKLGQFNRILRFFQQQRVGHVVMAGGITKAAIWSVRPDALALKLALRLRTLNDDALLRGIGEEIEKRGMRLRGPAEFLPELLAPAGVMTRRVPTPEQWEDLRLGWRAAKLLGQLDIGQGVVVRRKAVVAVEAIEGTDAMLERAGPLAGGDGVLVKVCKPQQDRRLDLPTVGPRTVANMARAGLKVLAVEAGSTLMLDPQGLVAAAEGAGIVVVGVRDGDRALCDTGPQQMDGRDHGEIERGG